MKLELEFEGMTCLGCARTLEKALEAVPGVEHAGVSYPTRRGTVVASAAVAAEDLLRAAERAGYRAEVVGGDGGRAEAMTVGGPTARQQAGGGGYDYDLLVIGSGGAGMAAAIRASELGATAAVVEGAEVVGGTCVNVGCIPSKYLIEAAHAVHTARTAFPGVAPCEPELAWREVIRKKDEIVERLRQEKYVQVLEAYHGVSLLRGRAELLGGGRVRVGDRDVKARKVLIATGARAWAPPIPGLEEAGALDSTSVMEIERLPETLIVIGGGSIGLELGQAFSRFGVRVVVIEAMERIVPGEDLDVSEALTEALRAEGIEIHTGAKVTRVSRDENGYAVEVQDGGLTGEIRAEQLLVATGRRPNTEGLGLEAADVEIDGRGFVVVDDFMRTSNPDVFAAGDVVGGPGFVYVAALQGGIAAQAALAEVTGGEPIPIDLSATPRVTFTDPQVAAVGITEGEARAAGLLPEATSMPMEYLPRAIVSNRRRGMIKLVSEAGTDRLLGAHIVSANAGDVIGEAVLAVRFGLTTRDLLSTLHAYLTWGEGLKLAAQTFTKDVAKLSCCA